MAPHMSDGRANLRKSGVEEEYDEKAQLLEELVQLAKDCNYRIKLMPRRSRPDPSAAATAPARSSAMQRAAADIRDAAVASQGSPEGTEDSPSQAALLLESLISPSLGQEGDDVPPPLSSPAASQDNQGDAGEPEGHATATQRTVTRTEPLRAKRRQDAADIEFLEKK
ncbi:hypothetical protein MTO96_036258 [Rhipicephalus appendiculatus]